MAKWRENQVPTPVDKPEHWTMYFDGSLKLDGGGAGVLLISPRGEQLKYVLQILWAVSNNEAEYEALLHGLRLAISLGIKRLLVYGDSLLVVQKVNKEWDCNTEMMEGLRARSAQARKQIFRLGGSSRAARAQCWRRYLVQTGVDTCSGPTGSLHPGAQAAIHQVFSAGNHRRGSPTT
jgi:ribonuclease HI